MFQLMSGFGGEGGDRNSGGGGSVDSASGGEGEGEIDGDAISNQALSQAQAATAIDNVVRRAHQDKMSKFSLFFCARTLFILLALCPLTALAS